MERHCQQVAQNPALARTTSINPGQATSKLTNTDRYKLLGNAALLGTIGMLTHRLPARVGQTRYLITSDWKTYARIGLGLAAVQKINQAFDWKPKPWLGAIEAVAVINPLTLGLSVAGIAQALIMAPLVAGSVQVATLLNQKLSQSIAPKTDNKWAALISPVLISVAFGALGFRYYPRIVKSVAGYAARSNLFSKATQKELTKLSGIETAMASSAPIHCARGCSMGSIICLSEVAELLGGFGNWIKSRFGLGTEDKPA